MQIDCIRYRVRSENCVHVFILEESGNGGWIVRDRCNTMLSLTGQWISDPGVGYRDYRFMDDLTFYSVGEAIAVLEQWMGGL